MADAMEKWPNSEESNETVCHVLHGARDRTDFSFQGFALANNSDKSMYEILAEDPDRANRFAKYFDRPESTDGLLDNYPWEEKDTMVDIGGSHGSVAISIAERFPNVKCIVQDLPAAVSEGASRLPAPLEGRVTFMSQ